MVGFAHYDGHRAADLREPRDHRRILVQLPGQRFEGFDVEVVELPAQSLGHDIRPFRCRLRQVLSDEIGHRAHPVAAPERDQPAIKARLRRAWATDDHALALDGLRLLAGELERSHHGAAASLREGLEETLTLQRLGVDGQLWRTLSSTNPIESMIGICRHASRNVKHWQNGDMCLRWTAAGMLEAERQFRKIIGYKHLAHLALAVERDVAAGRAATTRPTTTTEPAATLAAAH